MMRANAVSDAGYYIDAGSERDTPLPWGGEASSRLGLEGVDLPAFKKLMANRTPDGKKLTPMDHPERRLGYDLTFSEPKSVSLMEQLMGDGRIATARRESVYEIMRGVVEPMAATRDRKLFGFRPVATGNLAYMVFDHGLSRPVAGVPDPNGHGHAVIPNATWHNGRFRALEIRAIKDASPLIQAAWHANYAGKLKSLGYDIRKTKDAFEIAGVSDATIRKFSRRSEIVELEAKRRQIKAPKGKAALGALTREKKANALTGDALRVDWMDRLSAREHRDLSQTLLKAASGARRAGPGKDAHHLETTLHRLLKAESAVPEQKLLTEALKDGVGEVTLEGLRNHIGASTEMVRAMVKGVAYVTTLAAMEQERQVLRKASRGHIRVRRLKRGEKEEPRPDERVLKNPLFEDLWKACQEDGKLLVVGSLRDYRKPGRGDPNAFLEDLAGLPTGQEPPKGKLVAKAIRVGRSVQAKWRQHIERMNRHRYVERMEASHGRAGEAARDVERGIGR